jgi:hypothetical protein
MLTGPLRKIRSSPLVTRGRPLETVWDVIWWWEARRILFNLIVGVTGTVTSAAIFVISAVLLVAYPNMEILPDPPIFLVVPVLAYAIGANICFAGGWIVELLIKYTWQDEAERFGTLSFTLGIVFAVLVTLLPVPVYVLLMFLVLALGV